MIVKETKKDKALPNNNNKRWHINYPYLHKMLGLKVVSMQKKAVIFCLFIFVEKKLQ